MSDLTCEQVEGSLDLYAVGEGDAPTRAAVARHLRDCPRCQESQRQAHQVRGLLEQRFQEPERLQRLWRRLEAERKPAPMILRPALWRTAALAASVLVAFGLSAWLHPAASVRSPGVQLAAVAPRTLEVPGGAEAMMVRVSPAAKSVDAAQAAEAEALQYPLDLGGKTAAEFRRAVRAEADADRLPPPPVVDLALDVRNAGREVLPLRFGDERTELKLELRSPGVLDVPAAGAPPPIEGPALVRLAPGEIWRVPVRRLAYGTRGAVRYLYWTAPGDYKLTITLRVPVEADPLAGAREVVMTTGPIEVRVGAGP
jgi:anti-sigma factor RsiW